MNRHAAAKWITLSAMLFIAPGAAAQNSFIRTFGGPDIEQEARVVAAHDRGFFVSGYTKIFSSSSASIYLLKIDSAGNHVFSKTYGGSASDIPTDVVATRDSGFALCGLTWSYGEGDADAFLMKTSHDGNLLWMKTYGTRSREKAFAMLQTADSGFAITGFAKYDAASADFDNKIFLIKTNRHGNLQWSKTYGGPLYEEPSSVIQTIDGGFLITGFTQSYGAGASDLYLIKTDSAGNAEWARAYGTLLAEAGIHAMQLAGSDFVIAGTGENCGFGNGDMLVIRINAAGDTLWSKCIGTTLLEGPFQIMEDHDGGILLLGLSVRFSDRDILLVRMDSLGNLLSSLAIGGSGEQSPTDFAATSDSGLIITGYSSTDANPFDDLVAIKLPMNGEAACFSEPYAMSIKPFTVSISDGMQLFTKDFTEQAHNLSEFITQSDEHDLCSMNPAMTIEPDIIEAYPNPFADLIAFKVKTIHSGEPVQFRIYDMMGQLMLEKTISGNETVLDGNGWAPGIYCYRIASEKRVISTGRIAKK